MTWLRIHDGFTQNAKIAELNDAQFRTWIRLLCYCASSRDPSVDRVAVREVVGLDLRRISTFHRLGLLDEIGSDFEIHNWSKYLPREEQNAARQAKWRARRRNAESNAGSNAPSNADPSRARTGTRGSPSRPKDQEPSVQPSTRDPASDWDGEDPDGLTEHDQPQNGLPDLEHVLKEIPR